MEKKRHFTQKQKLDILKSAKDVGINSINLKSKIVPEQGFRSGTN